MHIIYMCCVYNRSGAVGTFITNRSWQFCLSVVTWKPRFVTDVSSCDATCCSVLRLAAPPACGNFEAQVCHTESCVATCCSVLRLTAPPACGNFEAQVCHTESYVTTCCSVLRLTAPPACVNFEAQLCNTESCFATCCSVLRLTAPPACGNLEAQVCHTLVLQHIAGCCGGQFCPSNSGA